MAHEVHIQPSGLFCVFSTVADDILCFNMTEEELVDFYVGREREAIEERVSRYCKSLKEGKKYSSLNYDDVHELIGVIRSHHGRKRANEAKKELL